MRLLLAETAIVALAVGLGIRALMSASEDLIEAIATRLARPKVPECRVVRRDAQR